MLFKKATKEKCKLRLAIYGPSGSGKTYTALRMAQGIGGKVAVIDTEYGSASKYADRIDFDTLRLDETTKSKPDLDNMIVAISAAGDAGYNVIILDSFTHAWDELKDKVSKTARAKYQGNTFAAWNEGTQDQKRLRNAILSANAHVIATMRSKTAWDTSKDSRGKTQPVRIGLDPEQGKGIEYEFDMLVRLSPDHVAVIEKDRTGKFQDTQVEKPGEDFGKRVADWLADGAEPVKPNPIPAEKGGQQAGDTPKLDLETEKRRLMSAMEAAGIERINMKDVIAAAGVAEVNTLADVAQIEKHLEETGQLKPQKASE